MVVITGVVVTVFEGVGRGKHECLRGWRGHMFERIKIEPLPVTITARQ